MAHARASPSRSKRPAKGANHGAGSTPGSAQLGASGTAAPPPAATRQSHSDTENSPRAEATVLSPPPASTGTRPPLTLHRERCRLRREAATSSTAAAPTDALVLKIREGGSVQRRACYLALGISDEVIDQLLAGARTEEEIALSRGSRSRSAREAVGHRTAQHLEATAARPRL
jgi:hypothetical protein